MHASVLATTGDKFARFRVAKERRFGFSILSGSKAGGGVGRSTSVVGSPNGGDGDVTGGLEGARVDAGPSRVGPIVWGMIGEGVGCKVGLMVGEPTGDGVGAVVGADVGLDVGATVGASVGNMVLRLFRGGVPSGQESPS